MKPLRRPLDRRELQRGEPRIKPVLPDQGVVRSLRDDAALVEDHDAVGLEHGGQPVSDDEHRAPIQKAIQGLLDEALALRVERALRLV